MVESTTTNLNLSALEQSLQSRLYSEPLRIVPIQVRCVFNKDGALTVVVQHPEPEVPYPRKVFVLLREMLREENCVGQFPILLYLKLQSSRQPYAFHSLPAHGDIAPPPLKKKPMAPPSAIAPEEAFPADDDFDPDEELFPGIAAEDLPDDDDIPEFNPVELNPPGPREEKTAPVAIAIAALLSLGLVGAVAYVLTRPCVFDNCLPLAQAQNLGDQSLAVFERSPSGQEILQAQKELHQSIDLLETIPWWSSAYGEGQNLLKTYETRQKSLDQIVAALQKAARTANMSQNPPLSAETWETIRSQWQEVIEALEQIPPQDDYFPFVQQKIDLYEGNLENINRRLNQELDAQTQLESAQKAAAIAETRQGTAQTLEDWQEVYGHWQETMVTLEGIPDYTTAYTTAQNLIQSYGSKVNTAIDQQNRETLASNSYQQGIQLADLAKSSEMGNQWTRAVFHWRNAVNQMKAVPPTSLQYQDAQTLLGAYETALTAAQSQLKVAIKLQQAEGDLEKTCTAATQICSYVLDPNLIKVRLTASYMEEVRTTALEATADNNKNFQVQLLDHIASLEQALETIGNNAGIRLEVYDVNGVLLTTYTPRT